MLHVPESSISCVLTHQWRTKLLLEQFPVPGYFSIFHALGIHIQCEDAFVWTMQSNGLQGWTERLLHFSFNSTIARD